MQTTIEHSYQAPTNTAVVRSQSQRIIHMSMVRLIFIIYWLLIFEGALRKWGLPQYEEITFFIRAPFTLWLYGLALYHNIWPRRNLILTTTYFFGLTSGFVAILQMIIGEYSSRHLILVGYAWYGYFFYIPLAFIIGKQFGWQDIRKFIQHTLWIAVFTVPLMYAQFNSPRTATINMGFALDPENQFLGLRSALGHIRPSGFFTSPMGQQMFALGAFVFVAYAWLEQSPHRSVSKTLRILGTLAIFGMIGLSQSRGLFIRSVVILLAAIGAALLSRQGGKMRRIILWLILLVLFFTFIWPIALPTSYNVFIARWSESWESESRNFELGTTGRIFYYFYSYSLYISDTPPLGYLLGVGSNASRQLSWVQMPTAYYQWADYGAWAEQPLEKHIVDLGPFLGLMFILFRIGSAAWLARHSIVSTYRSHNPLPVLLVGFVSLMLITGQITNQGSVNGFCWIFFGLNLAVCRLSLRQNRELKFS